MGFKAGKMQWQVERPLSVEPYCYMQLKRDSRNDALFFSFSFSQYRRIETHSGKSDMVRLYLSDAETIPPIKQKKISNNFFLQKHLALEEGPCAIMIRE